MAKAAKDSSNMINLVFYERVRQYYRLAFGVWCILLSQNTFGENESDYKNKIVNVASWLWGNPLPTQINFDPLGYHFFDDSQPNDKQYLVGGVYHGFTIGTFINSCNKRIFYEGVFRQIYGNSFVSVNYVVGVMEGYHGKCGIVENFGPIFGHDPGPLAALNFKLYLSEHLSIDIISYGVGGLGGISYVF